MNTINLMKRCNGKRRNSFSFLSSHRSFSSTSSDGKPPTESSPLLTPSSNFASNQSWSEEWRQLGLGARLPKSTNTRITNLLFVQVGFGVDQHGDRKSNGATKAAVRAVRNAIEFNAIPGVIEAVPGGRKEMLIQVVLGVPPKENYNTNTEDEESDEEQGNPNGGGSTIPMEIDLGDVAKVFPYGLLLPIEIVVGGLKFPTGRIVSELGDEDDKAICVVASISIGYDNGRRNNKEPGSHHTIYNTKDGY